MSQGYSYSAAELGKSSFKRGIEPTSRLGSVGKMTGSERIISDSTFTVSDGYSPSESVK